MSRYDDLMELLEDVQSAEADRPESCSCHINPPCSRCCHEPSNEAMGAVEDFIGQWHAKD